VSHGVKESLASRVGVDNLPKETWATHCLAQTRVGHHHMTDGETLFAREF